MDDGYDRFVKLLDQSQHFPAQRLKALQDRGLQRFLRHANEEVPANKQRLAPLFSSGPEPDLSRWQEIPILTRSHAQEESRELRAASVPKQAGATQTKHTSGSTGTPLIHHRSELQQTANQAVLDRLFRWYQIDGSKSLIQLTTDYEDRAAYPEGYSGREWYRGNPDGKLFQLDTLKTTTMQQLKWLDRTEAAYLTTFPNNLRGLIEAAQQEDSLPPRFDVVLLSGEVLEEETRKLIADTIAGAVVNLYGASETGRLAASCPEHGTLHIHEEISFLEVVDDHGTPVPDGQTGRLVTTSFYNFAMPLIRYALGDYGAISETPCPCGRQGRTLKFVAGRRRNLFTFVDGTSKWPEMKMKDLRAIYPFRQMQVVQDEIDHLTIHMVRSFDNREIDHQALQEVFRRSLHPSLNITIRLCDEIRRTAGGKFEDFVSNITTGSGQNPS
ncbi:phenylacetate--CoA ligase family protein [Pararhizobium sp. IMCC21322]|uniref:phenylacetate--CoA ligase family protein n=1 Tax=Pararhizobium sp. IMCC21322 TaxID=3067903 RepID=UPI0027429DDA|nr:hypothetical protein [Pararhizobium sp. IMCC21322]